MSLRHPANSMVIVLVSLLVVIGTLVATGASETAQSSAPTTNAPAQTQQAPPVSPLGARNDLPNPYLAGVSWGQLPDHRKWGSTAGIAVGPDGNIWAIDRCGVLGSRGTSCADSPLDPILKFDPSGKFLKSFGKGLFVSPHKITVDHDGNLWVADNGLKEGKGQQVFKFDQSGKILMTLGKAGVSGPGLDTFDQPTEVAVAPNGDIFVADGHGEKPTANARIMKFESHGKFLKTWGKRGTGIGEFDCPHIYIDKNDVIYVADSESRNGEPGYGYNPGCRRGIRIGNAKDGSVKYFVPDAAPYPATGDSTGPEGLTADAAGNIYGAEFTMDVKKYARK